MGFDIEAARRCLETNRWFLAPPETAAEYPFFLDGVKHNADVVRYCFQDQFVPVAMRTRVETVDAMRTLWEGEYYEDLGLQRRGETIHASAEVAPAQWEALHTVYDAMFQIDPAVAHRELARVNTLGVVALVVAGVGAYALRRSTVGLIACAAMGFADILSLIILNGIRNSHRNAVDALIEEAIDVFPVDAGYYEEGQPDAGTHGP